MPIFYPDPSDSRLEPFRSLSDPELLRTHGLFVAEGRLVVQRVLDAGRYEVVSAMVNRASLDALAARFESKAPTTPVFCVETEVFRRVTGFNIHRGCLALVRRPPPIDWREAIADSRLIVVLEGVTNADNVGGVFRNAAAFGAGAVLLSPTCCDPLYRKAIRTSMGAAVSVPFALLRPWPAALHDVRATGFAAIGLSPRESSRPIFQCDNSASDPKIALVLGTEGAGLTAGAEEQTDFLARIPISPNVDSLNVAVAAGIALFRFANALQPPLYNG
jgi:tRNA G18 (ribose-2'-O)-methylase SpoU